MANHFTFSNLQTDELFWNSLKCKTTAERVAALIAAYPTPGDNASQDFSVVTYFAMYDSKKLSMSLRDLSLVELETITQEVGPNRLNVLETIALADNKDGNPSGFFSIRGDSLRIIMKNFVSVQGEQTFKKIVANIKSKNSVLGQQLAESLFKASASANAFEEQIESALIFTRRSVARFGRSGNLVRPTRPYSRPVNQTELPVPPAQ